MSTFQILQSVLDLPTASQQVGTDMDGTNAVWMDESSGASAVQCCSVVKLTDSVNWKQLKRKLSLPGGFINVNPEKPPTQGPRWRLSLSLQPRLNIVRVSRTDF
jgi:hypothetical protein